MMNSDSDLAGRVRATLAHIPGVKEKKMFGSVGFMVRGNLCLSARAERIMCRIDPAIHAQAIQRKGCQSMVMKGRIYQGYVQVDAAVLKTQAALNEWVELALEYNKTLAPKNKDGDNKS